MDTDTLLSLLKFLMELTDEKLPTYYRNWLPEEPGATDDDKSNRDIILDSVSSAIEVAKKNSRVDQMEMELEKLKLDQKRMIERADQVYHQAQEHWKTEKSLILDEFDKRMMQADHNIDQAKKESERWKQNYQKLQKDQQKQQLEQATATKKTVTKSKSAKRETNKGGEGCPPKADLQNEIQNIQVTFENTMGYQPEQPVKKPAGKKARRAAKEAAEAAARAVEAEENEAKNFIPRSERSPKEIKDMKQTKTKTKKSEKPENSKKEDTFESKELEDIIDIDIDSDDADLISQEDQMQAIQALQSGMAKFANRTTREVSANRKQPEKESKSKKAKKKPKDKEPTPENRITSDPKKPTKLAPGFSEWFNGEARAHWKRPCFNGFQTVVMGDSQLKIYGQNNKRRAGFSITSYSGCDLLEFLNILRMGVLKCEDDRRGQRVSILRREEPRKDYNLGHAVFPADHRCSHCEESCLASFEGNLILAFGLNNSLKAENKSFNGQNIQHMFKMIDSTINQMLPKVSTVYYIPAIRVDRDDWVKSRKSQVAFETVNDEVQSRSHSTIPSGQALKRGWISEDGVHLHKSNAVHYWEENFQDIERQIKAKLKSPSSK